MISHDFLSCLKPTGTNSFRLSSTKLYNGMGGNAQNMEGSTLDMFMARPGMLIHNRDQSGAEALIVAHLCRPGNYRNLFTCGIKPHTFLAINLFGREFNDLVMSLMGKTPEQIAASPDWKAVKDIVEKGPIWYQLAKKICHASTYKMGPRTFQSNVLKESFGTLRLSLSECKAYLDYFYQLFPEIAVWQRETVEFVRKKRYLVNLLGSPRTFGRNFDDGYEREIISWIPQSTVGEITHECVADTLDYIDEHDKRWNVVSNKHDSCGTEAPETESLECFKVMGTGMAVKMTGFNGVEFVMKCDAQIGKNFGKHHATKNPDGLKTYEFK